MKKFDVTLQITSTSLTLGDLSSLMGLEASADSHDRGSAYAGFRPGKSAVWEYTIWKARSILDEQMDLDLHIRSVLDRVSLSRLERVCAEHEIKTILDIAIYWDTETCSVSIPSTWLRILGGADIATEISFYP
jgi:hypothetical protein